MKRTTWKQAYQKAQEELQAERSLRMTFERIANRKADENRVLQQNNEQLEREARYLEELLEKERNQRAGEDSDGVRLRKLVESLRWRIFTLLKSTDVDAELFGMPKYTLAPEAAAEEALQAYLGRMADKYGVDEVHTEAHRYCIHKRVDGRCGLGEISHTCMDSPCPFEQTGEGTDCTTETDRLPKATWKDEYWEWYKKNAMEDGDGV